MELFKGSLLFARAVASTSVVAQSTTLGDISTQCDSTSNSFVCRRNHCTLLLGNLLDRLQLLPHPLGLDSAQCCHSPVAFLVSGVEEARSARVGRSQIQRIIVLRLTKTWILLTNFRITSRFFCRMSITSRYSSVDKYTYCAAWR